MVNPITARLLYFTGIEILDKLVEQKFQGEDLYVYFSIEKEKIILSLDDFYLEILKEDISDVQLFYEEGQLSFNYKSNECIFSYEHKISFEFLSLLYYLNTQKNIPNFLILRYHQMLNRDVFEIVDKERREIPVHDLVHLYNDIDETQYAFIAESFAKGAISEAPLIYIKYRDSGVNELGLLITYKKIYSPEGSIEIKDVESIYFEEHSEGINCHINGVFFSRLNFSLNYKVKIPFPYISVPLKLNEFPTFQILDLITKICNCLKNN